MGPFLLGAVLTFIFGMWAVLTNLWGHFDQMGAVLTWGRFDGAVLTVIQFKWHALFDSVEVGIRYFSAGMSTNPWMILKNMTSRFFVRLASNFSHSKWFTVVFKLLVLVTYREQLCIEPFQSSGCKNIHLLLLLLLLLVWYDLFLIIIIIIIIIICRHKVYF